MLVSMKEMLRDARREGSYVPAFNIYNLETMQAALAASRRAGRPVILAFGERYLKNASLEVIAAMARCLSEGHPHAVALHLDHCMHIECIEAALKAGFTSVMFDGSMMPIEENIAQTTQARAFSDAYGASLEAELGGLNDESGTKGESIFTDPDEAARFVRVTGVVCLAVSVGNAHGKYKGAPYIDMGLLARIAGEARVPLVLHGSSGIPPETIARAARLAVAKINVNTDIAMAGAAALKRALEREERMEGPVIEAREAMIEAMLPFYA